MSRLTTTLALAIFLVGAGATGCGSATTTDPGAAADDAIGSAARALSQRDGDDRRVDDRDGDGDDDDRDQELRVQGFKALMNGLRAVPALEPLFAQYGVPNPIVYDASARGLLDLLRVVRIAVSDRTVTITNRETGGLIYSAPLDALGSGTFHPEQVPGSTIPPPATCTSFSYSAWGACQTNGTQTRTVLSSTPSGCTGGAPVTSQACTYVPPAPACGTCHAIPPSTGKHAFHTGFLACSSCHGTGYSSTTVNATTHQNGTVNVATSAGWNGTSCSNGCHGSKTW